MDPERIKRHESANVIRPWFVFTGASCSGKSTTSCAVNATLGIRAVAEPARVTIEARVAAGESLPSVMKDLTEDRFAFQRWVLEARIRLEESLSADEPLILDRGIPDSVAYFRLYSMGDIPAGKLPRYRYGKVFWFEPLPMRIDGVRLEEERERMRLSRLLRGAYENLGYDVVPVPVASLVERTKLISDHLTRMI